MIGLWLNMICMLYSSTWLLDTWSICYNYVVSMRKLVSYDTNVCNLYSIIFKYIVCDILALFLRFLTNSLFCVLAEPLGVQSCRVRTLFLRSSFALVLESSGEELSLMLLRFCRLLFCWVVISLSALIL
jgi:hypothetical protein